MKTQQLISDKYVVPLQYLKEKSLLGPILRWKQQQQQQQQQKKQQQQQQKTKKKTKTKKKLFHL